MPDIRSYGPSPLGSRSPSMRNAGNLFGTTRYDQPGVFGALPGGRPARISGGVLSSWPAQKTQLTSRGWTGSGPKSDGRRARSVEMMTHRPTTGSFLSSDTLGILWTSRAAEQRCQGVAGGLALEQHRADFRADRQVHAEPGRQRERRRHGPGAFGDHSRLSLDGVATLASRERHAKRTVARQRAGARQHEVTHTGESGQRGRLSAQRDG